MSTSDDRPRSPHRTDRCPEPAACAVRAARTRGVGRALGCLLGSALGAGAATAAGPDLCEGLPTHTDRVEVRPVRKPPFMKRYRDPAFGATVMRITDAKVGEVFKPAYSTVQAWNADESRMILYRSGPEPGHVLLDGRSYEYLKDLDMLPADLEEVFWSHSDPNVFFYVSKYSRDFGLFQRYDVRDDSKTPIRDFGDVCGEKGLPVAGGDAHMQSLDDDFFGFRCQDGDGDWKAFTYRVSEDELHVIDIGEGTDYDEWRAPSVAPSGERVLLGSRSLTPDLAETEARFDMAKDHEHSNLGTTHDGRDALFQTVFDPSPDGCAEGDMWNGVGHLTVHVLETGECRPVVNQDDGYPYTTSGTHVSARAYRRPGWVVMSSIGYDQFEWFSNGRKAPALFSEIYLVNTDPENEVVCRVAQHRSFAKDAKTGDYNAYFGEPHATASPSGTRILFGSDWYDSGAVDAYVVELPAYDPEA